MESNLTPDAAHVRRRTRNTAIALGASVVVSLFFLMYAYAQKNEATEQTKMVMEYKQLVEDLHDHEQREIAALRKEIDSLKISCEGTE